MNEHIIKLSGAGTRGASASSALLRDLLDVLIETTRRTIRLRAEGRSTARGTDPDWLVQAADFVILGFEEGSTEIVCQARPVAEIVPHLFLQGDLFSPVDASQTGLDLLEETLRDLREGNLESDRYDDKILDSLGGLRKVFGHGVEALSFRDGEGIVIRPGDLERFAELRRRIPAAEPVRVAGLLDTLTASRRVFQLRLDDDTTAAFQRTSSTPSRASGISASSSWGRASSGHPGPSARSTLVAWRSPEDATACGRACPARHRQSSRPWRFGFRRPRSTASPRWWGGGLAMSRTRRSRPSSEACRDPGRRPDFARHEHLGSPGT